jgi:hypothetical protein
MDEKQARALLVITRPNPTVTRGECLMCEKTFQSRLANSEMGEWEIKIMFDRHDCNPRYLKRRIQCRKTPGPYRVP